MAAQSLRPLLSIGLPVYNGEEFLAQALDSLLAQTFTDFEVIVADNASTDATGRLCRQYAARDPRVRYIRNERNVGAIANFNRTFALSRARLFKWASHDDIHHCDYLASCIQLLEQDPSVVLAHSATAFVDDLGQSFFFDGRAYLDPKTGARQKPDNPAIGDSQLAVRRFWQVLSHARWGTHMFGVVRRDALVRTRLLPNFAGGDRAMLAELALLGRFRSTPRPLFMKRFHAGGSWALNQSELKSFLSPDSATYSRRLRQLRSYFSIPLGKPVDVASKALCMTLLTAHCARTAVQALRRKDARAAAHGAAWRAALRQSPISMHNGKGL